MCIRDRYNMYVDTVGDLLRQYVLDTNKETEILREVKELTIYTNRVLENIRRRYRCRVPRNIILDIDI